MRALLRASPKAQFKQLQQDPVPSLLASRTGGANYIAGFATHVNNAATADVTEEKTPSKPLWPLPEGEYPSFHRFSQPVAGGLLRGGGGCVASSPARCVAAADGVYTGEFTTMALCGFIRGMGEGDGALDRLWTKTYESSKGQI